MKIYCRAVSEILAAALLALIAAILGFIIFYYAINIYSTTLTYVSKGHCTYNIIDVEINESLTLVNITPIVYVFSKVPCRFVNEYLLINYSVVKDMITISTIVKPGQVSNLTTLSLSNRVYNNAIRVDVCVVSSDGNVKCFNVKR